MLRMLRVVIMEVVSRLEWLGLTHVLRVWDGRGGCSLARTMRVVVMERLAQCACSGRCSWRFTTIIILAPHPENMYLLGCRIGV